MNQIIGARSMYEHMAAKYGRWFTGAYKWRTFQKRVELREVPILRQERDRCRISFLVADVEAWFEKQFSDPSVLNKG